jgi:hypothetical protein
MVMMTHSDTEGEAGPVTRHAFDTVWAPKGWKEASGDKPTSRPARTTRRTQTTKEQE